MRTIILFYAISMMSICNTWAQEETLQKSESDDASKILEEKAICQNLKNYIIKEKFPVNCEQSYFLFGAHVKDSESKSTKNSLKIANYNLLHPGTSKSLYKDYELVAKVANMFDVIAAEEVLSLVGHDANVNSTIDDYINSNSFIGTPKELQKIKDIYRAPGYLKLLLELKKLDPSWSLILSPRGDAALQGSVEEHVGVFYRASIVSLENNPYCADKDSNKKSSAHYGCIIDYGSDNEFVSRRPFLTSFKAKSFQFSILASHVVVNYAGDDEAVTRLVKKIFNANSIPEVGFGLNQSNFARFAEVKLALEFIKKFSTKYKNNRIIFSSDTNLNPDVDYWGELLKINEYSKVLISDPTTVSPGRFKKETEETNGVANSYDHFVLNENEFKNCDNGEVYNYYNSPVQADIENRYMIRSIRSSSKSLHLENRFVDLNGNNLDDEDEHPEDNTTLDLDYPLTKAGEIKMNKVAFEYENSLKTQYTLRRGTIVVDDYQVAERVDGLKKRLFLKQLTNSYYYRFYQEILSDHFPVSIKCKI
jgi:hypothetical protein